MALYETIVVDGNEVPVAGALGYIYVGGVLATGLTDDLAAAVDNPLVSGAFGYVKVNIPSSGYTVKWHWLGRERRVEVYETAEAGVSSVDEATAAAIFAGTAADYLSPRRVQEAGVPVALVSAATITPDFNAGANFTLALGINATLANPSNMQVGDGGAILITQDGTGGRTLAYGNKWKFPGGPQLLSTSPGAIDLITYWVASSNVIVCNICKAFASV